MFVLVQLFTLPLCVSDIEYIYINIYIYIYIYIILSRVLFHYIVEQNASNSFFLFLQ